MNISPAKCFGNMTDEELVMLAREKNEDAFVQLVSRYSSVLRKQAVKYRNAQIESEDLVQEGLLGLLSAVQTYRDAQQATFSTYAYACMRNRMVSALRRIVGWQNSAEAECFCADELYKTSPANDGDPVAFLVEQEEMDLLKKRLQVSLTNLEYRVLMLHLSAYSYHEISEKLQISPKAVDNALQRLRRKLMKSHV